jgi:small subunit ribosomal protein S4
MGRYTGPSCRLCRQVGEKLFLKGERCYTPKCAIEKRRRPPGDRRQTRRRPSDYSLRLREKQKVRYTFGIMESQLARYMGKAQLQKGETGQNLLQLLERRLDNVVFRLNFADSRKQGRQLVNHGHIHVNGRRLDIASAILRPGDQVSWRPQTKEKEFVKELAVSGPKRTVPAWLSLDSGALTGQVVSLPEGADLDLKVDTRLIVEYYSR